MSWLIDRDSAMREGWGDRSLRVVRFRQKWLAETPTVDVALIPTAGIVFTAAILRRLVAREQVFTEISGVHLGTAVVTEGVRKNRDVDDLPDLPPDELRDWARAAVAAGIVTQYRATVGVCGGWQFHVAESRGEGDAHIVCYEPGEPWNEVHNLVVEVNQLDEYFRAAGT
jgi:hypothetical protein